ncbi:MAG: hypothetical protein WAM60_16630 [Candidatus Promineifilaceae bacterium]
MANTKSSPKGKRKSKPTPQDNVVAAFLSCARCSFFLAGYRLLHDDFEEAVQKSENGWLTLSWDYPVKQLIEKSLGCQIEDDVYYYQGSCKDCSRTFAFQASQQDDQPPTLKVAIKNH